MPDDITELFIAILNESGSVDIAESEFKKRIAEENQLKQMYNDWCHENGSSFRHGFLDFCDEYLDSRNSVWDSLTDYDE